MNLLDQNSGWLGLPPGANWEIENSASDVNPFINYRKLLWAYDLANTNGLTDSDFIALVRNLDEEVSEIAGVGFKETPLVYLTGLSKTIGKIEAGNKSFVDSKSRTRTVSKDKPGSVSV